MIVGVTNIIPFFGPYLGAIPSAILILVVDPMHPLNCVYSVSYTHLDVYKRQVASTCRSYNDLMQERRIPSRPDILP